jgi:hypothetical protein
MIAFTKNKQTDQYDIIGPAAEMREGATVTVTCRDGKTKQVTVGRVSKAFVARFGPLAGQKVAIAKVARRVDASVPAGYYKARNGEVMASGCAYCRQLGRMCPQCQHDYF